ncbi:hypothetical protein, partial [Pseudomonas sp. HMSC75E02]|uniref:hypothetical protein n=1 Tax=Pseudomonas sp. HMSC75E02 TaxID=1608908 RepID=UPI001C48A4F8
APGIGATALVSPQWPITSSRFCDALEGFIGTCGAEHFDVSNTFGFVAVPIQAEEQSLRVLSGFLQSKQKISGV